MKKIVMLILPLLLIIILISCGSKKILFEEGTFEGVGQGHHGPIIVTVTTDNYSITDIQIIEEYEMPEISKFVYEKIPNEVIRANNVDIDVVSGATYTSKGLIESINNALDKAKINKE